MPGLLLLLLLEYGFSVVEEAPKYGIRQELRKHTRNLRTQREEQGRARNRAVERIDPRLAAGEKPLKDRQNLGYPREGLREGGANLL